MPAHRTTRLRPSWPLALLVLALSCASRERPANTPTTARGAALVRDLKRRFPRAQGWFNQVSGLRFHAGADGLVPDWSTVRHPKVMRGDQWEEISLRMPPHADGAMEVGIAGRPGFWLRLTPVAAQHARVEVHDGLLVYPGAFGTTDLLYKVTPTRVDEYLNVPDAQSPHRFEYRVETGPEAGRLHPTDDGVEVLDAQGYPRLRIMPPFARDARGARRDGTLRLEGDLLVEEVDLAGLAFPVLIDPEFITSQRLGRERFMSPSFMTPNGEIIMASSCTLVVCPPNLSMPSCSDILTPTERYNPGTNTWRVVASVNQRRFGYVGGRLGDGHILMVSGCTQPLCAETTNTTENYDPDVPDPGGSGLPYGRWTTGPSVAEPHAFGGAVPLPDGNLIVFGGCGPTACTAGTEIYETARGAWRRGPAMAQARGLFTTTVLPDGRILVAGGCEGLRVAGYARECTRVLATAEVYDPRTDRWSSAGTMTTPRAAHAAVVLPDGDLLAAGGCSSTDCNPTLNTAERWSATANTWRRVASMSETRHTLQANRYDGRSVIFMGGCIPNNGREPSYPAAYPYCFRTTELYDPAADRWSRGPDMGAERGFFAQAELQDGRLVVIGGCNQYTCIPWTEYMSRELDGGVPTDAGNIDADPPPDTGPMVDTGPQPDTGRPRDSGTDVPKTDIGFGLPWGVEDQGACGCRVPGSTPGGTSRGWSVATLALLGLAAARRRRRA